MENDLKELICEITQEHRRVPRMEKLIKGISMERKPRNDHFSNLKKLVPFFRQEDEYPPADNVVQFYESQANRKAFEQTMRNMQELSGIHEVSESFEESISDAKFMRELIAKIDPKTCTPDKAIPR